METTHETAYKDIFNSLKNRGKHKAEREEYKKETTWKLQEFVGGIDTEKFCSCKESANNFL